jgi:hypothetical protein
MMRTLPHHHPLKPTSLMNNITLHQFFDAALFIFGFIWPVVGATMMIIGIICTICALCTLYKACARYNGNDD